MLSPADGRTNRGVSTSQRDAAIEFSFYGTGIGLLADKADGFGKVDVVVDEESPMTVDIGTRDFPPIFGATVYRKLNLANGKHSLRLKSQGNSPVHLESFIIYE